MTSRYFSQTLRRNRDVSFLHYKAKKSRTLRNWRNFYMYFKIGLNTTGLRQSHFRNWSACTITLQNSKENSGRAIFEGKFGKSEHENSRQQ